MDKDVKPVEPMTIWGKLGVIQRELKAGKSRFNDFGNYNYRSCEDILEAVKPLLAETETCLTLSDVIEDHGTDTYIKATAVLFENGTGEYISTTAYARESKSKKKMDEPQMTGTASSYARKYALNGLFCIDDNKDPDTNEYRNEVQNREQEPERKANTGNGTPVKASAAVLKTISSLCKATNDKKKEVFSEDEVYKSFKTSKEKCSQERAYMILKWFKNNYGLE